MAGRTFLLFLTAACALVAGCRGAGSTRDREFAHLSNALQAANCHPVTFEQAASPAFPYLEGPQPVDVYIEHALRQNPRNPGRTQANGVARSSSARGRKPARPPR